MVVRVTVKYIPQIYITILNYRLIDQYSIRPLITKSVDVVPIRQRRNYDTATDSYGTSHSNGVIIDEWKELDIEVISTSLIVMK